MSKTQSYTRYEVSSGTFSASYPDNSHINVSDSAQVSFSSLTIGAGSVLIIGKFASVTIASTNTVTVGDNSQIILQPGSTLTIRPGSSLQLSKSCLLDLSLGKLEMNGATNGDAKTIELGSESVLKLGNIPITGSGRISGPEFTEEYEVQMYAHLKAPCTFIFDGVDINGNWHMDRAYPQWFAKADCEDWSAPINKAIKLKRTGEVFLQRGYYPVKHSIRISFGIELIGESGIRRNAPKADGYYYPEDNRGAIVYAVAKKDSSNASEEEFEAKSLVLVNIIQNPDPSLNQANGKHWLTWGMWEKSYPFPTTAIRNIVFKNGIDDQSQNLIVGLNGIFVAGGMTLDSVRISNFKQALVRSRDYADNFIVHNCYFTGAHLSHYPIVSTTPDNITTKEDNVKINGVYMVRLDGDGDNLEFVGNNIDGGALLERALYIGQCRGGTVSDNIMHGDVELAGCRALTFSNNHMESSSIGRTIHIINSQVYVSNNFFYKGNRPNIIISGANYGVPAVAEIHNNTYLCTYHELDTVITEDLRNKFNSIKEIWMARSAAPEIIVGDGATANITNQYRQVALKGSRTWPLTVGIQFGAETQTEETNIPNDKATTLLNNLSPYLSCSGIINAGFSINGINHQLRDINKRTALMMPNKNDRWHAPSGTYEYYAVFVIDRQRNIIAYPDGKPHRQLKYNGTSSLSKDNFIDSPGSADAVSTLISIHGGTSIPAWSRYLRMYRCCTNSAGNQNWDTVDIPVVNTMILYDNGLFLSGYPWQICSEENPLNSLPDTNTLKFQDVTHTNEAVECTATTKPTPLPNSWNRGDKIYNVGNQTDWIIFIKK